MRLYYIYFSESSLTADRTKAESSTGKYVTLTSPGVLALALESLSDCIQALDKYDVIKIEFGQDIVTLETVQVST